MEAAQAGLLLVEQGAVAVGELGEVRVAAVGDGAGEVGAVAAFEVEEGRGVVGAEALQGPGDGVCAGVRAGVGVQSWGGVMVKRAFTWAWTVWRWGSRSRGGAVSSEALKAMVRMPPGAGG